MMHRRSFLAGGCAAASLVNPARAMPASRPIVLRLAFSQTFNTQLGAGASTLAKYVNEGCGGRVRVEVYPASEIGGDLETAQDMRAGVIDMIFASSVAFGEILPTLAVFDVPFLFRDVTHARTVLDGPIGQDTLALLQQHGIVGLAWGENGLRHITTSQAAVRSPKDLVGVKVRVPQTEIMLSSFKAFGAEPKPLAFQDIYAALASGELQAQENPLATIKNARFDRVQKYLCLTGHSYSAAAMMVSQQSFDKLTEQDQAILRRGAAEGAKASRMVGDESQKSDVEELRQRGMTIVTDVDRAAFVTALGGMQEKFAQQFGRDRLDAIGAVGR